MMCLRRVCADGTKLDLVRAPAHGFCREVGILGLDSGVHAHALAAVQCGKKNIRVKSSKKVLAAKEEGRILDEKKDIGQQTKKDTHKHT